MLLRSVEVSFQDKDEERCTVAGFLDRLTEVFLVDSV